MSTHEEEFLTIGSLAEASGVPAKTIRYYEEVELLPPPHRAANGYRLYEARAIHIIRFVGRARALGFSMEDTRELVALWNDKARQSKHVKSIANAQLKKIEDRIQALKAMQRSLSELIACCHGDDRPDCPILEDLAKEND